MKQQAYLLAAALTTRGPQKTTDKVRPPGNKGPAPKAGSKQCAYYKQDGHWTKECPSVNKEQDKEK